MSSEERQDKQSRHAEWNRKNMKVLRASPLHWRSTNSGENLCFPAEGKVDVQFYPSTGRWYVPSENRTYRGMATSFIVWYRKRLKRLASASGGSSPCESPRSPATTGTSSCAEAREVESDAPQGCSSP